jgi:hypothetical protein
MWIALRSLCKDQVDISQNSGGYLVIQCLCRSLVRGNDAGEILAAVIALDSTPYSVKRKEETLISPGMEWEQPPDSRHKPGPDA